MIGLGSNRLSVCRRGGISVTQAGRGGMEWLAGGRVPDWVTPYSAQATAALKAQFPTQWPTILDYGFAHPEYIAAINFAAPQDPEIMYSLMPELGKVRKLIVDGGGMILNITPNLTTSIDFEFELTTANNGPGLMYLGEASSYWMWNNALDAQINGERLTGLLSYSMQTGRDYHLTFNKSKSELLIGNTVQRTHNLNLTSIGDISTIKMPYNISSSRYFKGIIPKIVVQQDGIEHICVPCYHDGENGLLDLTNAGFSPNVESFGSFTISETPAA